jgi:ankyrin repeat protein
MEAVKLLLDLRANMHAQTKNDLTPLHCAAGCGELVTVKMLLELGANFSSNFTVSTCLPKLHRSGG